MRYKDFKLKSDYKIFNFKYLKYGFYDIKKIKYTILLIVYNLKVLHMQIIRILSFFQQNIIK